eukprot:sb/3475791/
MNETCKDTFFPIMDKLCRAHLVSNLITVLASFLIIVGIFLMFGRCCGFGRKGVHRSSAASRWQSRYGDVPAGSSFSGFQRTGATTCLGTKYAMISGVFFVIVGSVMLCYAQIVRNMAEYLNSV